MASSSGSYRDNTPEHDVDMLDLGHDRDVVEASPNPLYTTPPRVIPRGPAHDFNGNPIVDAFTVVNSLPDAQLEARRRSSLPFGPPLTEDPTGFSADEAAGGSPGIEAAIRARTRNSISDFNRRGLGAFSEQCAAKVDGTPAKLHTTVGLPKDVGLKVQGAILIEELGPVLEAHPAFIESFKKPKNRAISKFLEKERAVWDDDEECFVGGVWDPIAERWILPEKAALEKDIYPLMLKVIAAIMKRFTKCGRGIEREVVDTHSARFKHKEDDQTSSPDFSVRARSSSFQKPEVGDIGYATIATFFEIKREGDMGSIDTHMKQLAIYGRQILAHQPNRIYVRCLLLSEQTCRLVHFDRSGAQVSPGFDIHAQPADFVRLVVALTSPDEKDLGFDDSIKWTISTTTGRKTEGTITCKTGPGIDDIKTYDLIDVEPIATHVIRGRATTCWSVVDRETKLNLIIKDSWTSVGRISEYQLLKKAFDLNLQGVARYESHETDRGYTKDHRCQISVNNPLFLDRVASRIVMKGYGKPVQYFTTILQLLSALYDAISGHLELAAQARILHRDINERNVLLGLDKAVPGWRGVLIDLNVAIDLDLEKEISKEARTGSRFFQSIRILDFLSGLTTDKAPAHDYLDDLEAFFFLLCWILFRYLKDGTLRPVSDVAWKIIRGWDSEDVEIALNAKSALFNSGRRLKHTAIICIEKEWGKECANLFRKFLEWVGHIQTEKERIRVAPRAQGPQAESIYTGLLNQIVTHYTQVLSFFEEAIVALRGSCEIPPSLNQPDAGPSNTKRPRSPDHEPEGGAPNPVRLRRVSTRLSGAPVV